MLNKKGLSTVVTTLIIVLLVLAAIAIIWTPIKNLLTDTTDDMSTICFDLDPRITGVTGSGPYTVIVERGSRGPATGVFVRGVAESTTGLGTFTADTTIGQLGKITLSVPAYANAIKIKVYSVYTSDTGESIVCDSPSEYVL